MRSIERYGMRRTRGRRARVAFGLALAGMLHAPPAFPGALTAAPRAPATVHSAAVSVGFTGFANRLHSLILPGRHCTQGSEP
jgi:hypothetical protein